MDQDPGSRALVRGELDGFVEDLLRRDVVRARDRALGLLRFGVPVPEILTGFIAPALVEIGERWHRNDIGVADEHAVTAIADAVVSVVTTIAVPSITGPRVAMVCAEGEWHVLPARLVGETMRFDGCDVIFLGASMRSGHLARFLREVPVDLVAISCSNPLCLEGVLTFTQVTHDAGVPAMVGGRALGADSWRAIKLGADLWAPDAMEGTALLRRPLPKGLHEAAAATGASMEIGLALPEVVRDAMAVLTGRFPSLFEDTADQLARASENLTCIVEFAQVTVLTGDQTIFDDFLEWFQILLTSRGVPAEILPAEVAALRLAGSELPHLVGVLALAGW